MKVELSLLIFGVLMIVTVVLFTVPARRKAANLTGQAARDSERRLRAVLIQASVVAGIAWITAAILYLRDIHLDFETFRRWFFGAVIVWVAAVAIFFYGFLVWRQRRLDPNDVQGIQALVALRRKIAIGFGPMLAVLLFFYFSRG